MQSKTTEGITSNNLNGIVDILEGHVQKQGLAGVVVLYDVLRSWCEGKLDYIIKRYTISMYIYLKSIKHKY